MESPGLSLQLIPARIEAFEKALASLTFEETNSDPVNPVLTDTTQTIINLTEDLFATFGGIMGTHDKEELRFKLEQKSTLTFGGKVHSNLVIFKKLAPLFSGDPK